MNYIICPDDKPLESFSSLNKAKKRAKELGVEYIRRFKQGKFEPYEIMPLKVENDEELNHEKN